MKSICCSTNHEHCLSTNIVPHHGIGCHLQAVRFFTNSQGSLFKLQMALNSITIKKYNFDVINQLVNVLVSETKP